MAGLMHTRGTWLLCVALLSLFLRGDARRVSEIIKRMPQTTTANSCGDGAYTAPNGLGFTVTCNQNSPGNDLINVTATDVYDCMNQCSEQEFLCYGAIWDNELYQRCFFKTSNISSASTMQEQDVFMGIVNATQLESLPTTCPYTNGSVQSTSEDYQFRIYCGSDLGGFDQAAPTHADTLADCMEQCDSIQPLCLGVAWNPDMQHGYDNCYFKATNDPQYLDSALYTVHVALALDNQTSNFNSSCNDGSTYISNNKEFTFHCGQDRPGSDLYANHTSDLGECVGLCANYFNSSTGACQAVAFNPDSSKSWANCYLKTAAGTSYANGDFDVAILTNGSAGSGNNNGTNGSSGNTHHSSSKAWIAGPVIGAVVAIAVIAGLFFWLRKRRNNNNSAKGPYAGVAGESDSQEHKQGYQMGNVTSSGTAAYQPPQSGYDQVDHKYQPDYPPPAVEADSTQVRHELSNAGEALPPQELDASSPRATELPSSVLHR